MKQNIQIVDFNTIILVITLNVNGLSIPAKDYQIGFKKRDPIICCLQKNHFKYKDRDKL